MLSEYHCVYSSSYRVPVLMFRFSFPDGQPLSNTQTLQALHRQTDGRSAALAARVWLDPDHTDCVEHLASSCDASTSSDFPALSAVVHPRLSTPFLSLHPCRTAAVMDALQRAAGVGVERLDVLAWLSALGLFVGLRLPFTSALQADLVDRLQAPV